VTLLVILLVVGAMAGLSWLLYRRPSGRIDPEQLPEATTRFRDRDDIDTKVPWNAFKGRFGPYA
jgi:hypothetical protein